MDDLLRLRAWSYGRQKLSEPARSLGQALDAVVAVYATHPTAPLALWARTGSFTPARYRRFDRERKGVRLPAMRGTVFLVPNKSAARIFSATHRLPAQPLRPRTRQEISTKEYERLAQRILARAQEPVSRKELETAVGIRGGELGDILRGLRIEGRILTLAGESLLMSPHRFVATAGWLPEGLDAGDSADALAWLAGEYLKGYGPARVADFAWWAGVTKSSAKKAFEAQRTIDVGEGLQLLAKDKSKFERVKPLRDAIALLPKWDAYTMGLAPDGRQRFVHPDVQRSVYTPIGTGLSGDGNPIVLIDGEAVATWTFSLKEGPQVQPFAKLGAKVKRRVDETLEEIAGLLTS